MRKTKYDGTRIRFAMLIRIYRCTHIHSVYMHTLVAYISVKFDKTKDRPQLRLGTSELISFNFICLKKLRMKSFNLTWVYVIGPYSLLLKKMLFHQLGIFLSVSVNISIYIGTKQCDEILDISLVASLNVC